MALSSFVIRSAFFGVNANSTAINSIAIPQRAKLKQVGPDSSGLEFVFPFGPQSIEFGNHGLSYDTVDRPGQKGVLTATNQNLRTVSIEAVIASKSSSGKTSVEGTLNHFMRMSEEPYDCAFTYGVVTLPYRVRITDVSYTAIRRDLDGNIIQASIDFELTESVQVNQSIVALTAITYAPPPAPKSSSKKSTPKPKPASTGGDSPPSPPYVPKDVTIPKTPYYPRSGHQPY